MFSQVKPKNCVLAFGLYNVHALSGVTEGGILGMTLLLQYWFHISPAVSSFIMNAVCYIMGWRLLGRTFIAYSIVAGGGFSLCYGIFEQFDPIWPGLVDQPLLAALLGALFVGVGVGVSVRAGGAPGGDDALAMCISHLTHWRLERSYMISDLVVLVLSISYINPKRLLCSLLTVMLSGQIIGIVQRMELKKKEPVEEQEIADSN